MLTANQITSMPTGRKQSKALLCHSSHDRDEWDSCHVWNTHLNLDVLAITHPSTCRICVHFRGRRRLPQSQTVYAAPQLPHWAKHIQQQNDECPRLSTPQTTPHITACQFLSPPPLEHNKSWPQPSSRRRPSDEIGSFPGNRSRLYFPPRLATDVFPSWQTAKTMLRRPP